MVSIEDAADGDRATVAAMLARAFHDDPAMCHIFPDAARRRKRLPRLFALLFDTDARGWRLVSEGREAATLWRGPGEAVDGVGAMVRQLPRVLHALGPALPRALAVSHSIEAHFPTQPFWYLHIAGVAPEAQGRGLGGRLIRTGLARADAAGVPVYLETATQTNVSLYRSFGFAETATWTVGEEKPRFWGMMRPVP